MSKLYLAGPIEGLKHLETVGWRNVVQSYMPSGIECVSPMRGFDFLDGLGEINATSTDYSAINPIATQKAILFRDSWDVRQADALFVNLLGTGDRISKGTVFELGITWALNKPVILVVEPDNIHHHPMIDNAATYITADLYEAIDLTRILFGYGRYIPKDPR